MCFSHSIKKCIFSFLAVPSSFSFFFPYHFPRKSPHSHGRLVRAPKGTPPPNLGTPRQPLLPPPLPIGLLLMALLLLPIPNHLLLHPHFPLKFPILSLEPTTTTTTSSPSNRSIFSLSKRTLLLITPPHHHHLHQTAHHHPWLIKIGQDTRGRTRLFHPLSRFPIKPTLPPSLFPSHSPHQLNVLDLPIFDMGHEFVLATSGNAVFRGKVVLSWLGSQKDGFALLAIQITGRLALSRSDHPDWTIIPDMPKPYDDVCVHKGSLFAVDCTGRTVMVGLDSNLNLVADGVFGGHKKFLVACESELYLVDEHLSTDYQYERALRFDVYRLEEEERRWVEVRSLGDRVLFLGDDCAFSALASDLGVDKGDRVVFRDATFNANALEGGLGVFHLDEGRISPLSDYPSFSKLFWPPPDWVGLHGLH